MVLHVAPRQFLVAGAYNTAFSIIFWSLAMTIHQQFFSASAARASSTLDEFAQIALAAAEQTTLLNLKSIRSQVEESLAQGQSALGVRSIQDLSKLQSSWAESALSSASHYAASLYQIAAKTHEALSKLGENHYADLNKSIGGLLDHAEKSAPSGSELGIVAVKSALSAANSAFDQLHQAGKQVAAITEANVAAASGATAKVVSAVGAGAKRKVA